MSGGRPRRRGAQVVLERKAKGENMDPVAEIIAVREEARQREDPQVDTCFLATVTAAGRPEVRAISLRDIDAKGFGLLRFLNRINRGGGVAG